MLRKFVKSDELAAGIAPERCVGAPSPAIAAIGLKCVNRPNMAVQINSLAMIFRFSETPVRPGFAGDGIMRQLISQCKTPS
jgi:hypothetical protein